MSIETFYNVVRSSKWREIELAMKNIYPEEYYLVHDFKKLFWKLFNTNPSENQEGIIIDLELYDDEEHYYDNTDEEAELDITLLDEKNWNRMLSYYICPDLLKRVSKEEIVIHIFFESLYGELN